MLNKIYLKMLTDPTIKTIAAAHTAVIADNVTLKALTNQAPSQAEIDKRAKAMLQAGMVDSYLRNLKKNNEKKFFINRHKKFNELLLLAKAE